MTWSSSIPGASSRGRPCSLTSAFVTRKVEVKPSAPPITVPAVTTAINVPVVVAPLVRPSEPAGLATGLTPGTIELAAYRLGASESAVLTAGVTPGTVELLPAPRPRRDAKRRHLRPKQVRFSALAADVAPGTVALLVTPRLRRDQ